MLLLVNTDTPAGVIIKPRYVVHRNRNRSRNSSINCNSNRNSNSNTLTDGSAGVAGGGREQHGQVFPLLLFVVCGCSLFGIVLVVFVV